jgi:ankyrin repeat protein
MRGGSDSTVEFLDEDKGIVVTGFQLNLILSNASPVTLFSPAIRGIDDAIDAGDIDAVADLIAKDLSCVNRTTGYGMSPINLAALRGHVAIVKLLIAKGASPVEPTGSGESGLSTPLHKAAEGGRKDVAELLLANHADVNAKDNQGATPLHWAAAYGHQDVVELLLTNKADVNAKANDGATPLHYAAYGRQTNVVVLLLANKADVNAKDNKGYTPLHFAVANQRKDVADLLRHHGGHE